MKRRWTQKEWQRAWCVFHIAADSPELEDIYEEAIIRLAVEKHGVDGLYRVAELHPPALHEGQMCCKLVVAPISRDEAERLSKGEGILNAEFLYDCT